MNHCHFCGNNIPDEFDDCRGAGYACDGPKTREGIEESLSVFQSILNQIIVDEENSEHNAGYYKEYYTKTMAGAIHQELQKAREERTDKLYGEGYYNGVMYERERIEAIFKEHVPPHAMDLEDSVWLKRLLNKAFHHES